jgi:hypothetical protein
MWLARSRTKFLLLSFHGGTTGFETIKIRDTRAAWHGIARRSRGIARALLTAGGRFPTIAVVSARPSNRPPSEFPGAGEEPSQGGHGESQDQRPGIDRILPELIRRGLEVGREKVSESIPRELASQIVSQLGDVRSGVVKAVAQEVGRFLREADIASEIRKVLTGLNVEAQVRFGFTTRDDGTVKPDLDVSLGSSDAERERERTSKRPAK